LGRASLTVRVNGVARSWQQPTVVAGGDEIEQFGQARALFLAAHNSVTSFHGSAASAEDLLRSQNQLPSRNEAMLRKWQTQGGRQ
jgi:hypothetical protein